VELPSTDIGMMCLLIFFAGYALASGRCTSCKVKRTILHLECWWGAHLPSYGREPVGG